MDHVRVREKTASHIEDAWDDHYRHFLSEDEQKNYRRDMRRDGNWGDELVLSAFAAVYQRPVVVHDRRTLAVVRTYGEAFLGGRRPPRRVAFSTGHYDAVEEEPRHP